jgi:hypothetical protein
MHVGAVREPPLPLFNTRFYFCRDGPVGRPLPNPGMGFRSVLGH